MIVKLLTEHHLEFLSLKGGCRGSSESTHVKMPHCWKSHALAHFISVLIDITLTLSISNTFLFLFSNKMLFIKIGIHKMLIRKANREDPDQTALKKQSDLGLCCLSRH